MSHYKCNHLVHSSPQSDDAFPPTAILFEYCLNIKDTDKSGWMPLHIAAGSLNTEAIAALIASGANTNFTTKTCYWIFSKRGIKRKKKPEEVSYEEEKFSCSLEMKESDSHRRSHSQS